MISEPKPMLKRNLYEIIKQSSDAIQKILAKPKYISERKDLPKMLESFGFFLEFSENNMPKDLDNTPDLPTNLKELTPGVYKKEDLLICATAVTPNEFRYKALYIGSLINHSCVKDDMEGIYLSILKQCSDGIHFEASAFGYLIRSDFFTHKSTRFIVPFLILPTTIPDELEYQWVYLAMRELSNQLSPSVEFKYLLTEKEEIDLIKTWGLF